jgi:restriction endonuclease Mrr
VQGATPIHFVDGLRLAKLCEEYQIGVVRDVVTLPVPDLELFDALRAN